MVKWNYYDQKQVCVGHFLLPMSLKLQSTIIGKGWFKR